MSCPYYWWDNHYACRKAGKDVNEDVYYKYCRNYDYGDCPVYKGNTTSGCFLTSACVDAKGLSDDCYELTVLRNFRDTYMKNLPYGEHEVKEYYKIAPQIVDAIKEKQDAMSIFERIYNELILPCVELIENGKKREAYEVYKSYTLELKNNYL